MIDYDRNDWLAYDPYYIGVQRLGEVAQRVLFEAREWLEISELKLRDVYYFKLEDGRLLIGWAFGLPYGGVKSALYEPGDPPGVLQLLCDFSDLSGALISPVYDFALSEIVRRRTMGR